MHSQAHRGSVLAAAFLVAAVAGTLSAFDKPRERPEQARATVEEPARSAPDPWGLARIDCSQIDERLLEKQLTRRAHVILAHCRGQALELGTGVRAAPDRSGGPPSLLDRMLNLPVYGNTDVNLITGTETAPHVTQDESAIWGHGDTVVVVYNDSSGFGLSPQSLCGVSVSTDGGATFTRLPYKFNTGGACYGEPAVFYSVRAGKWFVSFLTAGCGDSGIGQWESPDGVNWSSSGCVASGMSLDHGQIWVDNNPSSPYYGRQYAAFINADSSAGGFVFVTFSVDDGVMWSAPVPVTSDLAIRPINMTGSPGSDGTVFVQLLDEGFSGLTRVNHIARSTNGGSTWSVFQQTLSFQGPGRASCGSRAAMYGQPNGGYWWDMGGGQAGVGPGGVVHYVYSARSSGDPGDIYYIRSIDNGANWSLPIRLNTDTAGGAQWGPSLSVNAAGGLFVSWYDERDTITARVPIGDFLARYGRASTDNGLTWQPDAGVSDVIFPKPLPLDTDLSLCYAGLYNHATFSHDGRGAVAYHSWTDGRVSIGGSAQQDVFFDRQALNRAVYDFDPDRRADVSVFRPSDGTWYLLRSQGGFAAQQFGISTDRIVPADYDGDHAADPAVFRNGIWYLLRSALGFTAVQWGQSGDVPVPGDFDGDTKSDIAVFRPAGGFWYRLGSNIGVMLTVQFGQAGDIPVAADYDGDGRADIAVFRPSTGQWHVRQSSDAQIRTQPFGQNGDVPTPGDFDGDNRADFAVFRPSQGTWYILRSGNGQVFGMQFGQSGDIPVAGDYDGDGKADLAVFRNGTWYLQRSAAGFLALGFGFASDKPVPAAYLPQ